MAMPILKDLEIEFFISLENKKHSKYKKIMGITLSRYTHFVIVHHTFSNSSFDHKPHENHTYLIRTLICLFFFYKLYTMHLNQFLLHLLYKNCFCFFSQVDAYIILIFVNTVCFADTLKISECK